MRPPLHLLQQAPDILQLLAAAAAAAALQQARQHTMCERAAQTQQLHARQAQRRRSNCMHARHNAHSSAHLQHVQAQQLRIRSRVALHRDARQQAQHARARVVQPGRHLWRRAALRGRQDGANAHLHGADAAAAASGDSL